MQAMMISVDTETAKRIMSGEQTAVPQTMMPESILWQKPFKVFLYCKVTRKSRLHHPETGERMDGRVFGSVICRGIYKMQFKQDGVLIGYRKTMAEACMTERELTAYGRGGNVYGWHLEDFVLFDAPWKLEVFGVRNAPKMFCQVEDI